MIFSYNRSQRDALFLDFILVDVYQNKVEKQCISLASVIRTYYDARFSECQSADILFPFRDHVSTKEQRGMNETHIRYQVSFNNVSSFLTYFPF